MLQKCSIYQKNRKDLTLMESETFNKAGYLKDNFRLFHLTDTNSLPISYHYHDFYKVFLLLRG